MPFEGRGRKTGDASRFMWEIVAGYAPIALLTTKYQYVCNVAIVIVTDRHTTLLSPHGVLEGNEAFWVRGNPPPLSPPP